MMVLGLVAVLVSGFTAWGLEHLIARERRGLEWPPSPPVVRRWRPWCVVVTATALCLLVGWGEWTAGWVETPEVQPSAFGRQMRVYYHACLMILLVAGTAIDWDCYLLPDAITVPGFLLGVIGAVSIQELQIAHLWVDWIYEIPGVRGPYIPEWYDAHRGWHALAWSLTGAASGAAITYAARGLSSWLLGQEALGFGDVTFMAMIGSFLGWQAVLLTFAIAPLTGLVFLMVARILSDRPYMPYGPCLAAAAVVVLLNWTVLWRQLRMFFSDLVFVGIVLAIAAVALVVLLGIWRRLRPDAPPVGP